MRRLINLNSREELLKDDPLRDYFVWWDDLSRKHVAAFEKCLARAQGERELQAFLAANPILLVQHLGGGHGRWVIPQKRLGAEHVADFVVGECSSKGHGWQAIELESPRARLFTRHGDPTQQLTHGIRQILDWRAWLKRNQSYAARPLQESGLGLIDISPAISGLIIVGRRSQVDPSTNERRRQMSEDLAIQIHTYDFLLEAARGRVASTEQQRRACAQEVT